MSFFYVSSVLAGAASGRWSDRTRNVKLYVNIVILVQIIGFAIYLIPYHPIILLVRRTLWGLAFPFLNVTTGEVFRMYDKKDEHEQCFTLGMSPKYRWNLHIDWFKKNP